jgi:hypothetical protein
MQYVWRRLHSYLKHSEKNTSADASKPESIIWSGVQVLTGNIFKGITFTYNNIINKALFKTSLVI